MAARFFAFSFLGVLIGVNGIEKERLGEKSKTKRWRADEDADGVGGCARVQGRGSRRQEGEVRAGSTIGRNLARSERCGGGNLQIRIGKAGAGVWRRRRRRWMRPKKQGRFSVEGAGPRRRRRVWDGLWEPGRPGEMQEEAAQRSSG